MRVAAAYLVLVAVACTACGDGGASDRTIEPTARPFAEMFRLVRAFTPEQSPESPIVRISGATWSGNEFAIADVSEGDYKANLTRAVYSVNFIVTVSDDATGGYDGSGTRKKP